MNTQASNLIKCPESGEYLIPVNVWESRLPNGNAIQYGQFRLHPHQHLECLWSLLVVPIDETRA